MTLLKDALSLLKQTFIEWSSDNAPRLAAALAYYVVFSLAPLLVLTIAVAGFVLQESLARSEVMSVITDAVGPQAATFVGELIDGLRQPGTGVISTLLGLGALLLGALGAFEQLKSALNTVWNVPDTQRRSGIGGFLFNKLLSFGMILVIGFLLLASLILNTLLSAFQTFALSLLPQAHIVLQVSNLLLSYGIIVLLFAMIYRFLPDITLEWRDVWVGALVTTLLFNLGKFVLGLYLVHSGTASAYGAAGSFVLIMLWIYYSAQIVLFGAEFTQVYSRRYGSLRDHPLPPKSQQARDTVETKVITVPADTPGDSDAPAAPEVQDMPDETRGKRSD